MATSHTTLRCPICHQPSHSKYRPFCSVRCAEIDLGRWLKESYRIPAEEEGESEREEDGQNSPLKGGRQSPTHH